MRHPSPQRQRGFSLIELAVSSAIYSMGLGSVSLLMLLALQGTTEARQESLARIEAASLAELILMNSDAVGHYALDPAGDAGPCDADNPCTPAEMAVANLAAWRQGLADGLPGATGLVCLDGTPVDGQPGDPACDGLGSPVVKVFWQRPDGAGYGRAVYTLP